MSGSSDELIQAQSDDRVLDFGAVRFHNAHLQAGQRKKIGCRICGEGLESAMAVIEKAAVDPQVAVAEGDGANEEENASPSSRDGQSAWWNEN